MRACLIVYVHVACNAGMPIPISMQYLVLNRTDGLGGKVGGLDDAGAHLGGARGALADLGGLVVGAAAVVLQANGTAAG